MDHVLGEFIWSEKYRPLRVDDIVMPEAVKKQVKANIKDGKVSNFLFNGPPGTGKTTLAYAIAKEINADVLKLNGSGSGIDKVRNEITAFCSTMSLTGSRKIVLVDEADGMSAEAFARLRGTIQEFSKNTSFIFTCNYKLKIPEPVRTRFVEIDFKIPEEEGKKLMMQMMTRMIDILKAENYAEELDKEEKRVVAELVKKFFPNNRVILNKLQTLAEAGKLDAASLSIIESDRFADLLIFLKEKKWKKMREWVATNGDVPPDSILNWMWEKGEENFGIEKMPHVILHSDDYQDKVNATRHPPICTSAFFTRLMQVI